MTNYRNGPTTDHNGVVFDYNGLVLDRVANFGTSYGISGPTLPVRYAASLSLTHAHHTRTMFCLIRALTLTPKS